MTTAQSVPSQLDTRPGFTLPLPRPREDRPAPARPSAIPRPTLSEVLSAATGLPPQTAILGVCADCLPVLFDLTDPTPGPLLVIADPQAGKAQLLKTVLDSALALNSPYEVKYALLSAFPQRWAGYDQAARGGYCFSFHGCYEDAAARTLIRLAEIAEQRHSGRERGPAILLIMDDLSFMPRADFDVRANFEWLLKNGPSVQIWPIAALHTQQAQEMGRLVSNFHTRLIGHMPTAVSQRLALFAGLDTERLQSGREFAVRIQEDWLSFTLPSEG